MKIKFIASTLAKLIVNIGIMLFSLSCVFPIFWLFNSSLKTNTDFIADIAGLTTTFTFSNYVQAIETSGLMQSFFNSGLLAFFNIIFTVIFSFIVGYFISRYNFKFKKAIYILFVSGMIIPVLSLMIPVFIQFSFLDLLDHRFTLLIPYVAFSMPFAVILMENYVKSIPAEMDEAAYIEGCSTFNLLAKIIFPMCSPVTSILVITSFMSAWNEFPFSLVLIRSEHLRTISVALRSFNAMHSVDYTLFMSALIITMIPVIIIYICFSKKIIEGMTVGAVKG